MGNEHPEITGIALAPCCFPTKRHLAQQVVYQLGDHRFAAQDFLDSKRLPSNTARFARWAEHIVEGLDRGDRGQKMLEQHRLHFPKSRAYAQDLYIFAERPIQAGSSPPPSRGPVGGKVIVEAEYGHAAATKGKKTCA